MKKFIFLSLAVASIYFFGCQGKENLTEPEDLGKPGTITWELPIAVNLNDDPVNVDLVAGQNQVVGYITIWNDGINIFVSYYATGGWTISETHLDAAYEPQLIPCNKNGNPTFGHFRYGETGLNGHSAGPYTILIADLPGTNTGDKVYIAAHAVVESDGSMCPNFTGDIYLKQPNFIPPFSKWNRGTHYFPGALFSYSGACENPFLTLNGWCADIVADARFNECIPVDYLCTYDASGPVEGLDCFIDAHTYQNLYDQYSEQERVNMVNWIINNKDFVANLTWKEIQVAIWRLIDEKSTITNGTYTVGVNIALVEALLVEAVNHYDFVPQCGQFIAVIIYEKGYDCREVGQNQPYFVEWLIGCGSETAMAFNYPPDNTSSLFPGHVWFRYFGYQL